MNPRNPKVMKILTLILNTGSQQWWFDKGDYDQHQFLNDLEKIIEAKDE